METGVKQRWMQTITACIATQGLGQLDSAQGFTVAVPDSLRSSKHRAVEEALLLRPPVKCRDLHFCRASLLDLRDIFDAQRGHRSDRPDNPLGVACPGILVRPDVAENAELVTGRLVPNMETGARAPLIQKQGALDVDVLQTARLVGKHLGRHGQRQLDVTSCRKQGPPLDRVIP